MRSDATSERRDEMKDCQILFAYLSKQQFSIKRKTHARAATHKDFFVVGLLPGNVMCWEN
jgi:hypothetical protein